MGNDFKHVTLVLVILLALVLFFDVGKGYLSGKAVQASSGILPASPTSGQQQGKFCSDSTPTNPFDVYVPCTPREFAKQGTWCEPDNTRLKVQGCQLGTETCIGNRKGDIDFEGRLCTCFYTCSTPPIQTE